MFGRLWIASPSGLLLLACGTIVQASDLTTIGHVESRYTVNLGEPYGESVGTPTIPQGLYDYASSPGNASHWWEMNDGNPNSFCNTFGSPNIEDFAGYQFKLPASISEIKYVNRIFGDGGTFQNSPRVEVLDKPIKQGGMWSEVPATWDTPYDNSYFPGNGIRQYTITPNAPTGNVWGVRLIGAPRGTADGNGFIGVGELQVSGNVALSGPIDLQTNLARGQTPLWSHLQFNHPEYLTDGVFTENNTETTWGGTGDDYIGVLFDSTQYKVAAVGVTLRYFFDGGGFDPASGVKVQYSTDVGATWFEVSGLQLGRYPDDQADLAKVGATYVPVIEAFLFTFDPVDNLNGLRIIGNPAGPGDNDGFTGAMEFEAFGIPIPAQAFDYDNNGFINANDAIQFGNCISGPDIPQTSASCKPSDVDRDGDVDMVDYAVFQLCFSGIQHWNPDCGT